MRADLKRLRRSSDSGRAASASNVSVPSAPCNASPARAGFRVAHQRLDSGRYARQHKIGAGITAIIVVVLMAAAGFGLYSFYLHNQPMPFQHFTITRLTNTGHSTSVAISRDGKYVVNILTDGGSRSIWLRNIPSNSNTQVVPPAEGIALSGPSVWRG